MPLLNRLDTLHPWAPAVGGGVVGAAAVGGLLAVDHAAATGAALLVVGAGVAMARTGERRWVERKTVDVKLLPGTVEDPILGSVVQIPDTKFWMGSPDREGDDDEHPRHPVTLSANAIGTTVVTEEQWARVMRQGAPGQPRRPKVGVSWYDALRFCNAASARAGLRPCYQVRGQTWSWDRGADGYRLPTEEEWECAARAGTETRWSTGDDAREPGAAAWYGEVLTADGCHPVAQKAANPWGLYDVHGNAWEWCWDAYAAEFYASAAQRDPVNNFADDDSRRVIRGGAFSGTAGGTRSANRSWYDPRDGIWELGFRCVRSSLPTGSVTTKTAGSDSHQATLRSSSAPPRSASPAGVPSTSTRTTEPLGKP